MAERQFQPLEASQTGSNVAICKFDHGFLLVFNTLHFLSNTPRLKVEPIFLIVDLGRMSILIAKGRFETGNEVTSR
jgi:hypothetical protein